jgi:hypothetical protein
MAGPITVVPTWQAHCDVCGWSYEAFTSTEAEDQASLHEQEHAVLRCGYCGQPDGWNGRKLLAKEGYSVPLHDVCIADLNRWGAD